MLKLGVNIDHVATLRQARKAVYPDPFAAALLCEKAGAEGITAHLREDRRHIQDSDMEKLSSSVNRLNMEMAVTEEMIAIACRLKPANCCLVPEKRQELTTEGGLDVVGSFDKISDAVRRLSHSGITVSIFIDPDKEQLEAAAKSGAPFVELHTGSFANAFLRSVQEKEEELNRLIEAAVYAHNTLKLEVNAGHGIDYVNIDDVLRIPHLHELNIGHSIISRSIYTGIEQATREMLVKMAAYKF